jgi:hypothetical protein
MIPAQNDVANSHCLAAAAATIFATWVLPVKKM